MTVKRTKKPIKKSDFEIFWENTGKREIEAGISPKTICQRILSACGKTYQEFVRNSDLSKVTTEKELVEAVFKFSFLTNSTK